jgi:catechol 2,3-dioxygenase-like lactoylglutathione lyase family enzyme
MIGYVTVGANDLAAAQAFYDAFLPGLGYGLTVSDEGLSYELPLSEGQVAAPDFYVKPPFDGKEASAGNGCMVAFQCLTQVQVRAAHAAGCHAGGQNEGAPGFRAQYSAQFYVGYLRDPQGNKVALYCNATSEPARPN